MTKSQKKPQHKIAQQLYLEKARTFLEVANEFFNDYDLWNSPIGILSDTAAWDEIEPLFDFYIARVRPTVERHMKVYAPDAYAETFPEDEDQF
jgi:hypothetical protein